MVWLLIPSLTQLHSQRRRMYPTSFKAPADAYVVIIRAGPVYDGVYPAYIIADSPMF